MPIFLSQFVKRNYHSFTKGEGDRVTTYSSNILLKLKLITYYLQYIELNFSDVDKLLERRDNYQINLKVLFSKSDGLAAMATIGKLNESSY